ncbi:MAG: glycosyltransferase family 4 protein [Thaumarchaeota archaeon]|nr:glycosyltransferase family 4 protein [Nitrososphaerota archaeon]
MKILLLTQFFSTTKGGGEYVFSLMAKMLADRGNKVWVITNQIKGETYSSHKNIKIMFVPPLLEYKGGLPPGFRDNLGYSLSTLRKGISIIKKEKIDIIHSNNFAPALAGSMLSTITSKPHITTVHDVFSLCGKNYWKLWGKQSNISRLNVRLAPYFEKMIVKLRYDAIHTVSDASKDDLLKIGAKKPIYVIPNTIEISVNKILEYNPYQFVYVGRLVFYKNLEVIIKAVDIVRRKYPKVKLFIIGDGPHRKNLEELVNQLNLQENVKFTGFVSNDEKLRIISNSQALVFPSLCEGFGLVILEAFSQERPVLVSNIRPMSDIVTHENNGYALDPHDENIWAKHLIKIMENPSEAFTMGKNGNKLLAESYSQESMYLKVTSMYDNVLRKSIT